MGTAIMGRPNQASQKRRCKIRRCLPGSVRSPSPPRSKGRQKIDVEKYTKDPTRRINQFSKRRIGLKKSMKELNTLMHASVVLLIFRNGRLEVQVEPETTLSAFEFLNDKRMQARIEKIVRERATGEVG